MEETGTKFPNLEAELARANISKKDLMAAVGKSKNSIYNKLNGKTEITLNEARAIKSYLESKTGRAYTLQYLFNIFD